MNLPEINTLEISLKSGLVIYPNSARIKLWNKIRALVKLRKTKLSVECELNVIFYIVILYCRDVATFGFLLYPPILSIGDVLTDVVRSFELELPA